MKHNFDKSLKRGLPLRCTDLTRGEMSEIVFGGESLTLSSFATSGAAHDEKNFAAFQDEFVQTIRHIPEDLVRTAFRVHL